MNGLHLLDQDIRLKVEISLYVSFSKLVQVRVILRVFASKHRGAHDWMLLTTESDDWSRSRFESSCLTVGLFCIVFCMYSSL